MNVLRHHRSKRNLLLRSTVAAWAMLPFGIAMAYAFRGNQFVVWMLAGVIVFNVAMYARVLVALLRVDSGFTCELSDASIRCRCPVPSMGNSFELCLEELRSIEVNTFETTRIELIDAVGRRWWLTSNFGNPAWEFVKRIRQRNPNIEYREE